MRGYLHHHLQYAEIKKLQIVNELTTKKDFMKYSLIALLYLFSPLSFASDQLDIALLNGDWHCEIALTEDGIEISGTSTDSYQASDMSYRSTSKANFFFNDELIAILTVSESGQWQYQNKHFYYLTDTVDITVDLDLYSMLSKEAILEMQDEILNDRAPILTRSLNKDLWITYDETVKSESSCLRKK